MAKHNASGTVINPGDMVKISAKGVVKAVEVTYVDVNTFSAQPAWDIAGRGADGMPVSWKQEFDGGEVEVIASKAQ